MERFGRIDTLINNAGIFIPKPFVDYSLHDFAAITGIAPNSFQWGTLTAAAFLMILEDVTTWALTHFEPVRSWSVAEDFTPTEEQEGYGLIGRGQRMSASDYRANQLTRSLRDIANPKVRGAALWIAHALLTTCHTAASDRSSGTNTQDRQRVLLSGSAPASRQWLAQRQANWPPEYRRSRWLEVQELA
jgi:NAD(P)-dependent dehydrogenase (short-subunit alcohol dehydrogenase family)